MKNTSKQDLSMKQLAILLMLLTQFVSGTAYCQEKSQKPGIFRPVSWYAEIGSRFNYSFNEERPDQLINFFNIYSNLSFRHFNLVYSDLIYTSAPETGNTNFRLAYLDINRKITKSKWIPKETRAYVKAGLLRWTPSYTDFVLISERYIDDFISDRNAPYLGVASGVKVPILKHGRLTATIDAISGDLIDQEVPVSIRNAHLQTQVQLFSNKEKNFALWGEENDSTKRFFSELSLSAQGGIADGYNDIFNYAFLAYELTYQQFSIELRGGRLPAFEQSPYGFGIYANRTFKYIKLGAYYQYRLNREIGTGQIAGFSFRIIRPQRLVEFWNAFNFWYNIYDNTFMFNVPLIRINMDFKPKEKL